MLAFLVPKPVPVHDVVKIALEVDSIVVVDAWTDSIAFAPAILAYAGI